MSTAAANPPVKICSISGAVDLKHAKMLLSLMRDELARGRDFFYPFIDAEIPLIHRRYSISGAAFFIAWVGREPAGCLAIAPLNGSYGVGEIRRMYVRRRFRGRGISKMLMLRLEEFAQAHGYRSLYLDSLKFLKPAHNLYYSMGFSRFPPYNSDPPSYVLHMRKIMPAPV